MPASVVAQERRHKMGMKKDSYEGCCDAEVSAGWLPMPFRSHRMTLETPETPQGELGH
jgi:hypothetical protein